MVTHFMLARSTPDMFRQAPKVRHFINKQELQDVAGWLMKKV